MSPETTDQVPAVLVALAQAKKASDEADRVIVNRKHKFPKMRKTRIAREANMGIAKLEFRFERLSSPEDPKVPKLSRHYDAATAAAEDEVIDALVTEFNLWTDGEAQATQVLAAARKKVQKAEEELEKVSRRLNTALSVMVEKDPNFHRKQFIEDSGMNRSLLFQRIRKIGQGAVDLDDPAGMDFEEAYEAAKRAARAEGKARDRIHDARQERKQAIVDINHAAAGHIAASALASAAGLNVSWTRDFLTESPHRTEPPAPRVVLSQEAAATS